MNRRSEPDWIGILRNTPYLTDHQTCSLPRRNHRASAACLKCYRPVAAYRRLSHLASHPMMPWDGRPSYERGGACSSTSRDPRGPLIERSPSPTSAYVLQKPLNFSSSPPHDLGGKFSHDVRFQTVEGLVSRTPELCVKPSAPVFRLSPATATGPSIQRMSSQNIKIHHFDPRSQPIVREDGITSGEPRASRRRRVSLSNTSRRESKPMNICGFTPGIYSSYPSP